MDVVQIIPSLFAYDPVTGVLTRLTSSGGYRAGSAVGTVLTTTIGKSYLSVSIKAKLYYAHRIAFVLMTGCWPKGEVDHQDGNGLNNVWTNLRDVTPAGNCKNLRKYASNKSGCTGVCWDTYSNKWKVEIQVNGARRNLGRYASKDDAIRVRKEAEVKYGFHQNHGSDRPL
jgi:hypothetical protein